MPDRTPSKSEIFDNLQSQAQTLDELSRRITKIELSSETQEARNQNIMIGVLFAFLAIVVAVAVQVILANRNDGQRADNILEQTHRVEIGNLELQNQIKILQSQNSDLQEQLNTLKQKNPYLK